MIGVRQARGVLFTYIRVVRFVWLKLAGQFASRPCHDARAHGVHHSHTGIHSFSTLLMAQRIQVPSQTRGMGVVIVSRSAF